MRSRIMTATSDVTMEIALPFGSSSLPSDPPSQSVLRIICSRGLQQLSLPNCDLSALRLSSDKTVSLYERGGGYPSDHMTPIVEFFDQDHNSTGSLTSALSDNPQKVNGLAGVTLGA